MSYRRPWHSAAQHICLQLRSVEDVTLLVVLSCDRLNKFLIKISLEINEIYIFLLLKLYDISPGDTQNEEGLTCYITIICTV